MESDWKLTNRITDKKGNVTSNLVCIRKVFKIDLELQIEHDD